MTPYIILFIAFLPLCFINYGRGVARPYLTKWIPLFAIACFGGLRYQTGYDWQAYTFYFDNLNIRGMSGLLNQAGNETATFESGYYAINYLLKWANLPISAVFFASSIFNIWAYGRLLSAIRCNVPLAIIFYIGFCLIFFHFALVRQTIAVSFVFLACSSMIRGYAFYRVFFLILMGAFFQLSVFLYLPILALAHSKIKIRLSFLLLVAIVTLIATSLSLSEPLLSFGIDTFGLEFLLKYASYFLIDHNISIATYALLGLNVGIFVFLSVIKIEDAKFKILTRLTLFATLAFIVTVIIFPSNSSVWTRVMMLSSTLQGISFASCNNYFVQLKSTLLTLTLTAIVAIVYIFTIYTNMDFLVPYQTILHEFYRSVDSTNESNTDKRMQRGPSGND